MLYFLLHYIYLIVTLHLLYWLVNKSSLTLMTQEFSCRKERFLQQTFQCLDLTQYVPFHIKMSKTNFISVLYVTEFSSFFPKMFPRKLKLREICYCFQAFISFNFCFWLWGNSGHRVRMKVDKRDGKWCEWNFPALTKRLCIGSPHTLRRRFVKHLQTKMSLTFIALQKHSADHRTQIFANTHTHACTLSQMQSPTDV